MTIRHIDLTQAIADALELVARAKAQYVRGRDSASLIELPKLALADAVLDAVAAQQGRRLDRLPARAQMVGVVDVAIRPKRRRRA